MFPRISALLLVALALALVAGARKDRRTHVHRDTTVSQCSTGSIHCCNSVANASDLAPALDLLSYSYSPADSVGVVCTPINVYGAGQGAACQAQPVCCSNNTYDGMFNVGCSPIDLN